MTMTRKDALVVHALKPDDVQKGIIDEIVRSFKQRNVNPRVFPVYTNPCGYRADEIHIHDSVVELAGESRAARDKVVRALETAFLLRLKPGGVIIPEHVIGDLRNMHGGFGVGEIAFDDTPEEQPDQLDDIPEGRTHQDLFHEVEKALAELTYMKSSIMVLRDEQRILKAAVNALANDLGMYRDAELTRGDVEEMKELARTHAIKSSYETFYNEHGEFDPKQAEKALMNRWDDGAGPKKATREDPQMPIFHGLVDMVLKDNGRGESNPKPSELSKWDAALERNRKWIEEQKQVRDLGAKLVSDHPGKHDDLQDSNVVDISKALPGKSGWFR